MEKSDLAGNAVTFLHDEDYLDAFQDPVLGAGHHLNVTGRAGVSLNGDWRFAIDPFDTGFRQRWYAFTRDAVPEPHDWNPFDGDTCAVPSVWNLHAPELFHYEGGVWFTRSIDDPRTNVDDALFLRIGAANYCARVFLDGQFLGRHLGGSTPFVVDISALQGRGELLIHVENNRDPARLPCHHFDWLHYGGLHRDVVLFAVPHNHLRDMFVHYADGAIHAQVTATPGVQHATLTIPELGIDAQVPLTNGRGEIAVNAQPELWAPGAPRLYDVTVRAGNDVLHDRVGFRTIRTDGRQVLVNDVPVFLKGICVHEDDRDTGRVTSAADIRRRFAHARELGCNFMRLAHYPHHELAAQIADEEGLMLWAELPAYWSVAFEDPGTLADARNQLAELILRDRNRASVVMWGLANETADTPPRNAFMQTLADDARALDPSRPLAAACLFNQQTLTVEDTLAQIVDVVGINEYFGWYDADIGDLSRLLDRYDLNKPLVISETGCDIVPGDRRDAASRNSEAFGVAYYRDQIAAIDGHAAVSGFVPWLLYDFRSARRQNRAQQGWNRKGLISEDKSTYKDAFHVVASFFGRN